MFGGLLAIILMFLGRPRLARPAFVGWLVLGAATTLVLATRYSHVQDKALRAFDGRMPGGWPVEPATTFGAGYVLAIAGAITIAVAGLIGLIATAWWRSLAHDEAVGVA
jgi:hypothetical protein